MQTQNDAFASSISLSFKTVSELTFPFSFSWFSFSWFSFPLLSSITWSSVPNDDFRSSVKSTSITLLPLDSSFDWVLDLPVRICMIWKCMIWICMIWKCMIWICIIWICMVISSCFPSLRNQFDSEFQKFWKKCPNNYIHRMTTTVTTTVTTTMTTTVNLWSRKGVK